MKSDIFFIGREAVTLPQIGNISTLEFIVTHIVM